MKRSLASRLSFFVPLVFIWVLAFFGLPLLYPLGKAVFGSLWGVISLVVLPLVVCGLVLKATLLSQLARKFDVTPQAPAEFAGVREKTAVFTPPPAPLPEVPSEAGRAIRQEPAARLDFYKLQTVTAELLALGFTIAREGAVDTGRKNGAAMFIRIFEHASGAIAEVYQLFPVLGEPMPLSVSFSTYYPDDWRVIDSNQRANWITRMWVTPRMLVKGHEPDVPIRAVWQSHQDRRAKVEAGLSLQPKLLSAGDHLAHSSEFIVWMRKCILRRSLLIAWIGFTLFRPKNRELWGEFHKFAKT